MNEDKCGCGRCGNSDEKEEEVIDTSKFKIYKGTKEIEEKIKEDPSVLCVDIAHERIYEAISYALMTKEHHLIVLSKQNKKTKRIDAVLKFINSKENRLISSYSRGFVTVDEYNSELARLEKRFETQIIDKMITRGPEFMEHLP